MITLGPVSHSACLKWSKDANMIVKNSVRSVLGKYHLFFFNFWHAGHARS